MAKRKHNWNSYESDRFHSEGPSCDRQYDYNNKPNNQNEDHNTSANNTQDLVKKNDLYRNPEILRAHLQRTGVFQYKSKYHNNWTDRCWLKQNDIPTSSQRSQSWQLNFKKPRNSIEENLQKMFAQPAEISKGKSMLEKMGWKGGGLGKDGNGIVDPIAPMATYAARTIGLGLLAEIDDNDSWQIGGWKNKRKNLKKKAREQRQFEYDDLFSQNFRTNVLLIILKFVKNNSKMELWFEEKLSSLERKLIHNLVVNVRECDDPEFLDFDKDIDKEIVRQIMLNNNYILDTESYGKGARRIKKLQNHELPK